MQAERVECALCVGVNIEEFSQIKALTERYSCVYGSVGVHPDHEGGTEPTSEQLMDLSGHSKIVAIGETGLDYYRLSGDLEWQKERFRRHIRAAKAVRKPLIVHTRDAAQDTLRIMAEESADEVGGVMHCFTESWEVAQAAMKMNFYISFSGIVTFKNALAIKDVAKKVPLDRLLVETDSPYLAPVPFRGKTNQPAYVRYVAEEMARLKGVTLNEIADATTRNFFSLFRIPPIETS